MWLLTAGPLIGITVPLAELANDRTAGATALSRRDQDRQHTLVLPRVFALLHSQLPPLWGPWTFEECPVHLGLSLFLAHHVR